MSAATVTAVAAVAAAGTAAYSASQAGKGGAETYGTKVEPVPYEDRIGTPDSYARGIYDDTGAFVDRGLPQIFDISQRVNKRAMQMRERVTGGEFRDTIRQEGANILGMERGQVPADVVDSINRIVAENLGGAYDPTTAGAGGAGFDMSASAADAAKRLGLTSLDMMKTGMSFGPQWRSNVDSFVYKPQDAAAGMFFPSAQVALNASQIQAERDLNEYNAANNIARAAAMPDPAAVGSMNDQMIGSSLLSRDIMTGGSALSGLINAYRTPGTTSASTFAPAPPATPYIASARVGSPGVYSGTTNLNVPMV